jgi:hypothetical protein
MVPVEVMEAAVDALTVAPVAGPLRAVVSWWTQGPRPSGWVQGARAGAVPEVRSDLDPGTRGDGGDGSDGSDGEVVPRGSGGEGSGGEPRRAVDIIRRRGPGRDRQAGGRPCARGT